MFKHKQLGIDKEILSLVLPSLGTLLVEPLILATDTAMVGRLGTTELAGLGLGATILSTVWGIFIFLTYTTTASVAHKIGEGDKPEAIKLGINGVWLGVLIGFVLSTLLVLGAPIFVSILESNQRVALQAQLYLQASSPGIVGILTVLAGTGILRGIKDARTPFMITAVAGIANIALNWTFIFLLRMGIVGAGLGTAISQTGMGIALVWILYKEARQYQLPLLPTRTGLNASWKSGFPLFVRTVALRVCLFITVLVATACGELTIAAHQVLLSIYFLFSFPADSLGIAGQVLVGHALGAKDYTRLRLLVKRSLQWAVGLAVITGLLLCISWAWIPLWFTSSQELVKISSPTILLVGVIMPISGVTFCLDGVLIGAGKQTFLALGSILTLLIYAPVIALVVPNLRFSLGFSPGGLDFEMKNLLGSNGQISTAQTQILVLWLGFMLLFLGVRAITNLWATHRVINCSEQS